MGSYISPSDGPSSKIYIKHNEFNGYDKKFEDFQGVLNTLQGTVGYMYIVDSVGCNGVIKGVFLLGNKVI